MTPAQKARRTLLQIEIPRDELALRIAIKCIGIRPKDGIAATDALDQMNAFTGGTGLGMGDEFRNAADAAVIYMHECIASGVQPS